ncbi:MAG: FlgO family outer membrane protein [Elusimicrobiales bacterium]
MELSNRVVRAALRRPLLIAIALLLPAAVHAEPLEKLARKLASGLPKQSKLKLAVLGFPYAGGMSSSGSAIVQERLTTYLAKDGLEVIERGLLNKLLEENKLEMSGVLDPASTRQLGKVIGADAVVTGTLNDIEKDTEVNARIIEASTGKILAAETARLERTWTDSPAAPPRPAGKMLGRPVAQIAILLDTSNSMDGLISQARSQLWKIIAELGGAEKKGARPEIQVALYEYGNNTLRAADGYVRMVSSFTTHLDAVSEQMFSLKTDGGDEYCGWALRDAVSNPGWLDYGDVYKAVFIAGNEPFTQGPVDFHESARLAQAKGIFVNTIYCGPRQMGVAMQWKSASDISGGDFMNIDQDAVAVYARAPQDEEIEKLDASVQETYIPYGGAGRAGFATAQSAGAHAKAAGASAARAMALAAAPAAESSWDAASAVENGSLKSSEMKSELLPENMRGMSAAEREKYVAAQLEKRKAAREKILKLQEERRKYLAAQPEQKNTFGGAVISAARRQAELKGFSFK